MTALWRATTSTAVMAVFMIITSANSAAALFAPEIRTQVTAVPTTTPVPLSTSTARSAPPATAEATLSAISVIPGPLFDPTIRLQTGAVDVPLELQIPTLNLNAAVLGVGLTLTNAMASPVGMRPDDPIWQKVFWYRGGGIPGDIGTATIAGHYDDDQGRPAVFAFLSTVKIGDLLIVRDTRSGVNVPFIVTETKAYTDEEAAVPAVLERIFGSESVGTSPFPSMSDQLSHLTLITCAGTWVKDSFNLRLVVYATRASYPPESG